ncbi:MAG: adenylate/guanylate cyclase domain-containing protein [Anaerolineae bacterium]
MPDQPSGTVTFLFTDIEGSTQLWESFPQAMQAALARHDALLQQTIESHSGYVFKTVGDAFCAAFATAPDGLRAALDAQRALADEPWGDVGQIRVRMALHTGAAEERAGDYFGPPVNRVARLLSAGAGGQVLLSGVSYELARAALPDGCDLRDLGDHHLKDLGQPERVYQLVAADLPSDFPPIKTLDTFPNNLPVELTSFIGREREMAETKGLLASSRLLTFIGPGGAGKTRLSTQLAADLLMTFADGAWLVALAPLADPAFVAQTVAATFNLRERPGVVLEDMLLGYLRRKRLLLVLDNCEHLVEECARLTDTLLRACPQIKIVASSREALGIAGETIYRVPALSLPAADGVTPEALRSSEAAQLFVERARAAQPRFALTTRNAPAVAQICRRLDGIPLALELAAARVRVLTPEQIATRLDDRFRLLTGGSRTALPRQQTLRALIDWSYDLLPDEERALLRRLSVFVGGWTLDAAEAVSGDADTLDRLAQLVDKSLVQVDEDDDGSVRYELLETIRQYARDRLLEAGEAEAARDAHLRYFLRLAETTTPDITFGPVFAADEDWLDDCEREKGNYRAAMEWGLERDPEAALRLAGVLVSFWELRGYRREAFPLVKAALARVAALPPAEGDRARSRQAMRAHALVAVANMGIGLVGGAEGIEANREAVGLYEELGDQRGLAFALSHLGFLSAISGQVALAESFLEEAILVARQSGNKLALGMALGTQAQFVLMHRGEIGRVQANLEESARLAREAGSAWGTAMADLGLAELAAARGDWTEAETRAQEAKGLYAQIRDPLMVNASHSRLAHVARRAGRLDEAVSIYRHTIVAFEEMGQLPAVAHELECCAFIARAQGDPVRAARLLGAAEALRERVGVRMTGMERVEYDDDVAALRGQLPSAEFDAAWAAGRRMTLDDAVAYALEG